MLYFLGIPLPALLYPISRPVRKTVYAILSENILSGISSRFTWHLLDKTAIVW